MTSRIVAVRYCHFCEQKKYCIELSDEENEKFDFKCPLCGKTPWS